jgi:hypothetical protein
VRYGLQALKSFFKNSKDIFNCANRLHTWVGDLFYQRKTKKFFTKRSLAQKEVLRKNYVAAECPDYDVQTARLNGQSLQCTEMWKTKVGKRIYSRAIAKAKCEFESHRSDKK